jgi:exonuclease SbcC
MNILKLKLTNWMSFAELSLNFKEDGIYTIYGYNAQDPEDSNGIGKSAIKEAIKYLIYGKCKYSSMDDAVKYKTKQLTVCGIINTGVNVFKITRSRKKNKSTNLKLEDFKAKKDLTCNTMKQTQKIIEKDIVNYEQFMTSYCLDDSKYHDLKSLTSTKFIEFLKSILNLEKFNDYLDKIKSVENKVRDNLNQAIGVKQASEELKLNITKKVQLKRQERLEKRQAEIEDTIEEIEKKELKISEKLEEAQTNINKLETRINSRKKQLKFISKNDKCPTSLNKLKNSLTEKRLQKEVKELQKKIEPLQLRINKMLKRLNSLAEEKESFEEYEDRIREVSNKVSYRLKIQSQSDLFDEKEYKKLLKQKALIARAKEVFLPENLPLHALKQSIPIINSAINQELRKLCDFRVEIKTSKKLKTLKKIKNTCEIKIKKGKQVRGLESLSGAEEFLVSLGIKLGLDKIIYNTNRQMETLIIDEGFGKLSTKNIQKVFKALQKLKEDFKKIIIISHLKEINKVRNFNSLLIRKNGDTSFLVGMTKKEL